MKKINLLLLILIPTMTVADTLQHHTRHFIIYHSDQLQNRWLEKTAHILEECYTSVGNRFNVYPADPIPVIIFDSVWKFKKVTRQPAYIGAIYDGTLKIQPPAILVRRRVLKSILTHEYTHIVIEELCKKDIPLWLNEGLALYIADQKPKSSIKIKLKSFKELHQLLMERKSRRRLDFAYSVSLKIVSDLIYQYSWRHIIKLLKTFKTNESFELAFEQVYKKKYRLFEYERFQKKK